MSSVASRHGISLVAGGRPRGMLGYLRALVAGPPPGRLLCLEHRAPLQAQRLLHVEPGLDHLYVLSPTGGVLEGDDLDLDIAARDGARLRVMTQSATRVYRMRGGRATQRVRLEARGAYLEYLPHPLILYAAATFAQRISVVVEDGMAVLMDVVVPGRLASGEVWSFGRYDYALDARVDGTRVLVERGCLESGRPPVGMGPSSSRAVFGSLLVLGRGAGGLAAPLGAALPDGLSGATRLHDDLGALVRIAAADTASCTRSLWEAWDAVRDPS